MYNLIPLRYIEVYIYIYLYIYIHEILTVVKTVDISIHQKLEVDVQVG